MKRKLFFVLLILPSLSGATAQSLEKAEPVRVLILGTYHFGNPGHDLHNMKVDDVQTPEKQAELAEVATRLGVIQSEQDCGRSDLRSLGSHDKEL